MMFARWPWLFMKALVNEVTDWPRPTFSPTLVQPLGVPLMMSPAWARKLPVAILSAQLSAAAVIEPFNASGPRPPAARWLLSEERKPASEPKSRAGP